VVGEGGDENKDGGGDEEEGPGEVDEEVDLRRKGSFTRLAMKRVHFRTIDTSESSSSAAPGELGESGDASVGEEEEERLACRRCGAPPTERES
jgi:hypothetical protein